MAKHVTRRTCCHEFIAHCTHLLLGYVIKNVLRLLQHAPSHKYNPYDMRINFLSGLDKKNSR